MVYDAGSFTIAENDRGWFCDTCPAGPYTNATPKWRCPPCNLHQCLVCVADSRDGCGDEDDGMMVAAQRQRQEADDGNGNDQRRRPGGEPEGVVTAHRLRACSHCVAMTRAGYGEHAHGHGTMVYDAGRVGMLYDRPPGWFCDTCPAGPYSDATPRWRCTSCNSHQCLVCPETVG